MPTFSENGKNSYTAAATVAQGTIVKFSGSTDAAGLPTVTPTTAANDAAITLKIISKTRVIPLQPFSNIIARRKPVNNF